MPSSFTSPASSPRRSGPRAATLPPQYRPMEPSSSRVPEQTLPKPPLPPFGVPYTPRSQVNLRRLAGPPEGATPFTVAGLVSAPATEEGRGSLAVEPLTRGIIYLLITNRPATPLPQTGSTVPNTEEANPIPNRLGSGSPSRLSPLGNRIIRRVIRLSTSTHTQLAAGHPGAFTDARPSDSTVRRVQFCH
jgi:hypothetical protein